MYEQKNHPKNECTFSKTSSSAFMLVYSNQNISQSEFSQLSSDLTARLPIMEKNKQIAFFCQIEEVKMF